MLDENTPVKWGELQTYTEAAKKVIASHSNGNLLINPGLSINQRGRTEYSGVTYSVDGWQCRSVAVVAPTDGGLKRCDFRRKTVLYHIFG